MSTSSPSDAGIVAAQQAIVEQASGKVLALRSGDRLGERLAVGLFVFAGAAALNDDTSLALRARAVARVAHQRGALVRVPSPVLAETCRGGPLDAAINHFLNRDFAKVVDLSRPIAQRAGSLLAAARMSSAHAIDAFVVAIALEFDLAVIATGDPRDIKRLAANHPRVSVLAL